MNEMELQVQELEHVEELIKIADKTNPIVEPIYMITLSDGTKLGNLHMNGTCYVADRDIPESVFLNNCSPVTIYDGTDTVTYDHMVYQSLKQFEEGKFYFSLRELTSQELFEMRTNSNVEYIAMMSDVEL